MRDHVKVRDLRPGDVLWPTMRTVVSVHQTLYTGSRKREVVLERGNVRTLNTFGADTVVAVERQKDCHVPTDSTP